MIIYFQGFYVNKTTIHDNSISKLQLQTSNSKLKFKPQIRDPVACVVWILSYVCYFQNIEE
jgi:hypothetical protein